MPLAQATNLVAGMCKPPFVVSRVKGFTILAIRCDSREESGALILIFW
ncbi:hypothetical protein ODT09_21870 [Escherichia coli]|nr:hypothetical protein [Escherichia coli]